MMETTVWGSKDNDDCSDDDVNKGSDSVDNDVPTNMTDKHSKLCNKGHILCYGTLVSVINIVITISICVTTVVILPDYQKNGFHSKEDIFIISDRLESLSTELKTCRSQTIGHTKYENIFHDNHVLQKQNRRLKSELKNEKSKKEEENRKLTAEVQKEKFEKEQENRKLKAELQNEKLIKEEENRKLTAELQKEKFKKEEENRKLKVELQREKSKIEEENRKLKAELQKEKSETEEENRKLKAELQKEKSKTDSITCTDDYKKRIQRTESLYVSRTNYVYGWVFGNKSLTFGRTDNFDINVKIKLLYPEIPDNDKILFEFGLTTMIDYVKYYRPFIIVRGQRCVKTPGVCLYVLDDTLSKLQGPHFEQMSDYIQVQLKLELHKSHFVLVSNHRDIYKSNVLNISSGEKLWPVFGFYNIHLIDISQTIFSKNTLGFNRTAVNRHLFVSEDNNTIANYKLQHSSGWDIIIMYLDDAVFIMCPVIIFLSISSILESTLRIKGFVLLCLLVSLYDLYMNWFLYLLRIVSVMLCCVLCECSKNKKFELDMIKLLFNSILISSYIMIILKSIGCILYLL